MTERDAEKKAEMPDWNREDSSGTVNIPASGHQTDTACEETTDSQAMKLMEEVVSRENMLFAYHRVLQNKGAPGTDGISVEDLWEQVRQQWSGIREALLTGTYQPSPVRKVEIPKPGGRGMRMLGIPIVMDRMIQQALLQILQPRFDPAFSESSFGFRPGRSAHQAVALTRAHVASGKRWVVDMDLEKFFDRGIGKDRAKRSAYNDRGPWWNAGASHMNQAVPTRNLSELGLVSLIQEYLRLASLA